MTIYSILAPFSSSQVFFIFLFTLADKYNKKNVSIKITKLTREKISLSKYEVSCISSFMIIFIDIKIISYALKNR
jgi:hypothetical protein